MQKFQSINNRFLRVAPGVLLTDRIDPVICALDGHFCHFNMVRYVSSGYRLKSDQLRLIINYSRANGIPADFSEFQVDDKENNIYIWVPAWNRLLQMGYLIAPPNRAATIYPYKNKAGHEFPPGRIWEPSGHFNGDCFDISGSRGEQEQMQAKEIDDELEVLKYALANDKMIERAIQYYTIERRNNCLHVKVKETAIIFGSCLHVI